jgi:hypothetical protein
MAKLLMLFFLVGLFPITAHSVSSTLLTDNQSSYSLKFNSLEYNAGDLSITDVQKADIAKRFIAPTTSSVNYGFTHNVYWVKFQITHQSPEIDKWYLRFSFPNMQHIDFCLPDKSNTIFNCKLIIPFPVAIFPIRILFLNYLSVNYPAELTRYFIGDEFRLKQILLNLMGNALKFTEHGFVKIHVSQLPDSMQLHFCIEDSGIGLSTTQMETIFQVFTQADSSTTRRFGGTGLGTTIALN